MEENVESENNQTEVDFFEAHENFDMNSTETTSVPKNHVQSKVVKNDDVERKLDSLHLTKSSVEPEALGPSVNIPELTTLNSTAEQRKSTIGVRKPQPKKGMVEIKFFFKNVFKSKHKFNDVILIFFFFF